MNVHVRIPPLGGSIGQGVLRDDTNEEQIV